MVLKALGVPGWRINKNKGVLINNLYGYSNRNCFRNNYTGDREGRPTGAGL